MTIMLPPRFIKTYKIAAAAIAADSTLDLGITDADQLKYAPFNIINVVNRAGQFVELILDGNTDRVLPVPAAFDKVYSDMNFSTIGIKNTDAADANDGDIYVTVARDIGFREYLKIFPEIIAAALKRRAYNRSD